MSYFRTARLLTRCLWRLSCTGLFRRIGSASSRMPFGLCAREASFSSSITLSANRPSPRGRCGLSSGQSVHWRLTSSDVTGRESSMHMASIALRLTTITSVTCDCSWRTSPTFHSEYCPKGQLTRYNQSRNISSLFLRGEGSTILLPRALLLSLYLRIRYDGVKNPPAS